LLKINASMGAPGAPAANSEQGVAGADEATDLLEQLDVVAGVVLACAQRLDQVDEALDRRAQRADQQGAELAAVAAAVTRLSEVLTWNQNELQRFSTQLASLEARVERQHWVDGLPGAPADDSEPVRTLLEEARAEHERTRVRLAYLSSFEERLRRLEDR